MLRAALGFDHCARNVVDSWIANSGYKIERYVNEPTSGKGLIVDSNAKLSTPAGSASTRTLAQVNLSPYLATSGAGVIVVAFRAKMEVAGGGSTDTALWIDYQRGTTGISFLQLGQIFPTMTAGSESFVELVIYLSSGTIEFWRNGALISTSANYFSTMVAQFKLGNLQLTQLLASANSSAVISYCDYHVIDDVVGDGIVARIGDRKVYPIGIEAVTATGWTASNGKTPLEIMTEPTTTQSPGMLISSQSSSPMRVRLKSTLPSNVRVEGIHVMVAGMSSPTGGKIGSKLVTNGGESVQRVTTLTDSLLYGNNVGTYTKAPDGNSLASATINATEVVITPDV